MKSGSIVDGKYEILSIIGRGGMGCVYLARHIRLGTLWAIKEVSKEAGQGQDLLGEVNVLKRLDHPALPRIVDVYEDANRVLLIEDYIEGESLDKLIQRGVLPSEKLLRNWFAQLADVLHYLHTRKPHPVIHRDLKPSNIILTPQEKLKVIDFGIAREYKPEQSQDTVSFGTRGYAAPEQLMGNTQTDERTDIYSLGVTMFHLATGKGPNQAPYEFSNARAENASLSEGMSYIIAKCTCIDPRQRYENIAQLQRDLARIDSFSEKAQQQRHRNVIRLTALLSLFLLSALLARNGWKESLQAQERSLLQARSEAIDQAYSLLNEKGGEEAISFIKRAAQEDPDLLAEASFEYIWGTALLDSDDAAGAVAHFKQALSLEPDNVQMRCNTAIALLRNGDLAEAEALLQNLDKDSAQYIQAEIAYLQKDFDTASAYIDACLARQPGDELRNRCILLKADILQEEGKRDPAALTEEIAFLEAAQMDISAQSSRFRLLERLGKAYFSLGSQNDDRATLQKSASTFEALAEAGFTRDYIYRNIAIIYQKLGDYDRAKEALEAMLLLDPQSASAYIQLAFLTAEQEGKKEANERDYSEVQRYYEAQEACQNKAGDEDRQRLKALIDDLKKGGWL